MKQMLNNFRYLLDVDHNQISVNDHAILERDNPVKSELTFQLLNPDRVNPIVFNNPQMLTAENILKKLQNREPVTETSYIRFYFPYGTAQGDFIDEERGKLINFETESGDWSVAEGIVEDRHISFVISCYNQKIIDTLFSVYFKCKNIQSYAPVGLTYVYADIKNVVGIDDIIKVFPVQKKLAVPQINRYFTQQTTASANETTRIQWQISGAKEGRITPGEIDIWSIPAPSVELKVARDMEYRLGLKGNGLETTAVVNLYVRPPNIQQLFYESINKQVSWSVQYSENQQLILDQGSQFVDRTGKLSIQMPKKPQVALRAEGYIYTEYSALNLQGLTLDKPQEFRSRIRTYAQYVYSKWEWRTQEVKGVLFQISEDGYVWRDASSVYSGSFEYVSAKPLFGARLQCTKRDGSQYPLLMLDGGVM